MVVGAMTIHAFGEGMAMGLSFTGNKVLVRARPGQEPDLATFWLTDLFLAQGTFITFALGIHNVPEGLAIAVLLLSKRSGSR